jgi:hypothetical protein
MSVTHHDFAIREVVCSQLERSHHAVDISVIAERVSLRQLDARRFADNN